MEEPGGVVIVMPADRRTGPPTPGMDRQEALATEDLWAGFVRTEPGMVSGWHHHGEYETVAYVLTGSIRFEFGPGGCPRLRPAPGTSSWSRSISSTERATRPTNHRRRSRSGRAAANRRSTSTCPLRSGVELRGFEPLTSSMPWRRATNCATAPR